MFFFRGFLKARFDPPTAPVPETPCLWVDTWYTIPRSQKDGKKPRESIHFLSGAVAGNEWDNDDKNNISNNDNNLIMIIMIMIMIILIVIIMIDNDDNNNTSTLYWE